MRKFVSIAVAAFALAQAGLAAAQTPPPAPGPDVAPRNILSAPKDAPPPKAVPRGPYPVTVETLPSLATHTIYRPTDLTQFSVSKRLPIVSWGNGGCVRVGTLFYNFLNQIASHGYIVIAVGPKDAPLPAFAQRRTGPGTEPGGASAPAAAPAPVAPSAVPAPSAASAVPAPSGLPAPSDHLLIDAIDWAVKQNADKTSPLYKKLDPKKVAVMGQSCGGLQTLAVSGDPRIKTSVLWNSGSFPAGGMGASLSAASKESLKTLHAPTAYFIGGPTDIAYPNAEDDFKRIEKAPVFKGNLNVGHGGTFNDPGAGWFGEVGVAWLDWQLKRSAAAKRYFAGPQCTLCVDPAWKIEKKNMK